MKIHVKHVDKKTSKDIKQYLSNNVAQSLMIMGGG